MSYDINNLRKRLIYRSQYRGTKEMDKLIGKFVQSIIDDLNESQLKELEIFLNIDDDTLYKLYNNQLKDIELDNTEILNSFKNFNYKEYKG
tara:strand:- start:253 stop:525 length:273 start_codon:yes stop_codon:yes gene_type:complete